MEKAKMMKQEGGGKGEGAGTEAKEAATNCAASSLA